MMKYKSFCIAMIFILVGQGVIRGQDDLERIKIDKTYHEKMFQYSFTTRDGDNNLNMTSFDPAFFEEWLEWLMEESMIPGASLCFLVEGELYWKKHIGYADIEDNIAVSDSTVFLTCSVSKTIVITAIMQLYEQGFFQLDDAINAYLPFTVCNPNYPDSVITFRYLMTHLSSIKDELSILQGLITYGYDCPIPLDDFLEQYLLEGGAYYSTGNYSVFPPLGEYNYSNVGASLLAYLVEVFSGMDFEAYCQEHIFEPLGMDQTSFRLENLDPELLATPYLQEDDQLIPTLQPGFPVYPAANLRTSAEHLSRILSMYMNNGSYGKIKILNDTTIDLITTLQYPDILEESMGLIWFYKYNYFKHGGYFPGAQSEYGFTKDKKAGIVCIGNSANQDWSWFMEFWLLSYARYYEPFSIQSITLYDSDGDNLLEPGEKAGVVIQVRNNVNMTSQVNNISLEVSSDDPNIYFENAEAEIGSLQYLEKKDNQDVPFVILIGDETTPYSSELNLKISWDDGQEFETNFVLEIGQSEILLVNDGTSYGGMFMQPEFWYSSVLYSLGRQVHHFDISLFGDPTYEFISNFPIVIWYTGYQTENTLNEQNQQVLSMYLENGGKLFVSGLNISEEIEGSDFLNNYLHAGHVNATYDGQDTLAGIYGDPIGNDMLLTLNQGYDAMYQFSMSEIEPVNGGEEVFKYFSTGTDAAVRFDNGIYKTVFFSFGFEGINHWETRLEVMERILNYFDENVGAEETSLTSKGCNLRLRPNPVSSVAAFSYYLAAPGQVEICIYDLNGRKIRAVVRESQVAGSHSIMFSTDEFPAGLYVYSFTSGDFATSGKMMIVY